VLLPNLVTNLERWRLGQWSGSGAGESGSNVGGAREVRAAREVRVEAPEAKLVGEL
jgi:hypothetical protein